MMVLTLLLNLRFKSKMALRDVLGNFAVSTTMHGVPKVINAKSAMARLFWSIVCLAAGSMFCLQMSEVLTRYYSYPKKVTVEVVPTPVPFPSISICNMRNLDVHILNTLNAAFLRDDNPINHINKSDNAFINSYMYNVGRLAHLFWKYQDAHPEVFQEVFSRTTFSANIPEDIIALAAVQLDGFVVNCHYAGHRCNKSRDFLRFFDPYYFSCFTYKAPEPSELDDSLSEGIENGWSSILLSGSGMLDKNDEIRMLPGLHEWRSAVSASEGVRVVIHPPNTEPYPFTEGYDVPPGFSASFGIKPRRNIRIGPPHGNCTNKNPFDQATERYRLISCQRMCLQSAIIKSCNCSDVGLPRLNHMDVPLCRSSESFPESCFDDATDECLEALMNMSSLIKCVRVTKAKLTKNTTQMEECQCFPPCDEVAYDVSYSLSKWPASGYEGDAAYFDVFGIEGFNERFNNSETKGKYELFAKYFNVSNREETMKNFARLNVYIADSNVVKTQESADYTRNQLVSDIGGQLGLWVGISVITLTEVLELLSDLVRFFTSSYSRISRHDKTYRNNNMNHHHNIIPLKRPMLHDHDLQFRMENTTL
uniref:DEG/ENaC family ion channel ENaC6 n=1 Tax=Platynereis dumerilii TaxID=6359 RepID=A0A2S1B6R1_PLADU|nr:DEG/ENaC family ion channel ENaC6 [Platynereis dumerilii]